MVEVVAAAVTTAASNSFVDFANMFEYVDKLQIEVIRRNFVLPDVLTKFMRLTSGTCATLLLRKLLW